MSPRSLCFAGLVCVVTTASSQLVAEREVLVPVVVPFALGANNSLWATETRVLNTTNTDRSFHIVEWFGPPGATSATFVVPALGVLSLGGFQLSGIPPAVADPTCVTCVFVGAAVLAVDDGLLVETAILSSDVTLPPSGGGPGDSYFCPTWLGGYFLHEPYRCGAGVGPVIQGDRQFIPADTTFLLPWLNTDTSRRVNLLLLNPGPAPSNFEITIAAADGTTTTAPAIAVPPHTILQLNDVFSSAPWSAVRLHNGTTASAATARVSHHGPIYAIAFTISNANNSVSLSEPLVP